MATEANKRTPDITAAYGRALAQLNEMAKDGSVAERQYAVTAKAFFSSDEFLSAFPKVPATPAQTPAPAQAPTPARASYNPAPAHTGPAAEDLRMKMEAEKKGVMAEHAINEYEAAVDDYNAKKTRNPFADPYEQRRIADRLSPRALAACDDGRQALVRMLQEGNGFEREFARDAIASYQLERPEGLCERPMNKKEYDKYMKAQTQSQSQPK